MDAATPNQPQVCVRRWHSTYLVPRTHPMPERVRDRLDKTVRDDLPGALATPFAAFLDRQDDELIFVRRLELDFPVDAAWDRDAIAHQCANVLTWRLARELAVGDSSNVIRFANRTEYLARFIADLATGDAASRWYYARFSGLRALPCSVALRTAVLDTIPLGLSALRALADRELVAVLAALGERECARIRDALADAHQGGDEVQAFTTLIAMAQGSTPGSIASASQLALWWIARSKASADRAFIRAARAVAAAVVALDSGHLDVGTLLRGIIEGDATALATLGRGDFDALVSLRACPPALLRDLCAGKAAAFAVAKTELHGSTPFGGPFVLLDEILALALEDVTIGWPALADVVASRLLRFLILCHCGGGARAEAIFADPLWRRLFGIGPTLDRAAVGAWLASLGPTCRRRYARLHAPDGKPARVQSASDRDGQRYRIVLDKEGNWLALSRGHEAMENANNAALGDDIDHLLAQSEVFPRAWSLLIALTAQRVLRCFLRRLPGFAGSHLVYAQRNLLEFSASVEAQAERIVVRLARPPLGLILNLTGCNRGTHHWPLLDARPFALFNDG